MCSFVTLLNEYFMKEKEFTGLIHKSKSSCNQEVNIMVLLELQHVAASAAEVKRRAHRWKTTLLVCGQSSLLE